MSHNGAGNSLYTSSSGDKQAAQARKLELSRSPMDGSLLTASLSSVINAATDALYSDLHSMTYGEISITTPTTTAAASTAAGGGDDEGGDIGDDSRHSATTPSGSYAAPSGSYAAPSGSYAPPGTAGVLTGKKDKMASLSFAQRRHELGSRVARHSKAMTHVAVLVRAYCGTDAATHADVSSPDRHHSHTNKRRLQIHSSGGTPDRASLSSSSFSKTQTAPTGELASIIYASSKTLQHVHTSWVNADEAQDTLYFHHAELWKSRAHVHDVYGSTQLLLHGMWYDFPSDVALEVDRYDTSMEKHRTKLEVTERLRACVRRKLLLGEIGSNVLNKYCDYAEEEQEEEENEEEEKDEEEKKKEWSNNNNGNEEERGRKIEEERQEFGLGVGKGDCSSFSPWKVTLERGGGAVRLTYGEPRRIGVLTSASTAALTTTASLTNATDGGDENKANQGTTTTTTTTKIKSTTTTATSNYTTNGTIVYPIEARVTILSEHPNAQWILLSIEINMSAKTGESVHQLELTNRQKFNLHKLCARSMAVEEAVVKKLNDKIEQSLEKKGGDNDGCDGSGDNIDTKERGGGGGDGDGDCDDNTTTSVNNNTMNGEAAVIEMEGIGMLDDDKKKKSRESKRRLRRGQGEDGNEDEFSTKIVPRPLQRLFEVSHTFAVSLQLEILSAQAEALRKGAWGGVGRGGDGGAGATAGGGGGGVDVWSGGIAVTPVHFFDRVDDAVVKASGGGGRASGGRSMEVGDGRQTGGGDVIGVMAIHFWNVDDRYGPPSMGDLTWEDSPFSTSPRPVEKSEKQEKSHSWETSSVTSSSVASTVRSGHIRGRLQKTSDEQRSSKRLCLSIRAVENVGIVVSLSGGDGIMASLTASSSASTDVEDQDQGMVDGGSDSISDNISATHLKRSLKKLLTYVTNPFELSASDALLAATVICAERRCQAVVAALVRRQEDNAAMKTKNLSLPSWIRLTVECGTVSVAAHISYHGDCDDEREFSQEKNRGPVILFRLACDSRTGRFVPVFPRPAALLRKLACNDPTSSELQMLRNAKAAAVQSTTRRRTAVAASGRDLSGRIVRDAFDGLARSMDILGRRVGVGGSWEDDEATSGKLRERAIDTACGDVRVSLMNCCGIASVFGVAALAVAVAVGIDAVADVTGGVLGKQPNESFTPLPTPPLGIVLNQQMVEKTTTVMGGDDDKKKVTVLEREIFAVTGSVDENSLMVRCFDVTTQVDSPSNVPTRIHCSPMLLRSSTDESLSVNTDSIEVRASKRLRVENDVRMGPSTSIRQPRHILDEVQYLADRFCKTLGF